MHRLVGRDYEFKLVYEKPILWCELCNNEMNHDDEISSIKLMAKQDFYRFKFDLINAIKNKDYVHAEILFKELEDAIT